MTTYVLIHGASSAGFYWDRTAALLRGAGHSVVAPDLPIADSKADFDTYADAVDHALKEAAVELADLVVVGQSMGGFTAPVVADRHDGSRLVLVAPMIPAPGETPGQYLENVGLEQAQRVAAEAGGYDPSFEVRRTFLHDVPDEVVENLLSRGEPEQAETIFGCAFPLAAWPSVSTRVIAATQDRMFPLSLVHRVSRERLGRTPEHLDSGHLPGFGHPQALARLLLKDADPR